MPKRSKGKATSTSPPDDDDAVLDAAIAKANSERADQLARPQQSLSTDAGLLGKRVVLGGLQAKPNLNGALGQSIGFDEGKGRYVVVVDQQGGKGGYVLLKPESLRIATGEPVWRAEDSFFHAELARVTPIPEPAHVAAITCVGAEVRLTGRSAEIRTTHNYLATQGHAESCISFSVYGCRKLDVSLRSRQPGDALGFELDSLRDGSQISVALSVSGEKPAGAVRKWWVDVWCDGRQLGGRGAGPSSHYCSGYSVPFPEATKMISGVEVVTRYLSGHQASTREMYPWQGLHMTVLLEGAGARLVMAEADAVSDASKLSHIHRAQQGAQLIEGAQRGDLEAVRLAAARGASVDAISDFSAMSAAHCACQDDRVPLLQYIVSDIVARSSTCAPTAFLSAPFHSPPFPQPSLPQPSVSAALPFRSPPSLS